MNVGNTKRLIEAIDRIREAQGHEPQTAALVLLDVVRMVTRVIDELVFRPDANK